MWSRRDDRSGRVAAFQGAVRERIRTGSGPLSRRDVVISQPYFGLEKQPEVRRKEGNWKSSRVIGIELGKLREKLPHGIGGV